MKIQPGDFRNWLHKIWMEYCQEREDHQEYPILDMTEYFQVYKYWLKRQYLMDVGQQAPQPNNAIMLILDDKLDSNDVKLLSEQQNRIIKTLKENNEKQR
jgi:hypothetical protein